MSEYSITLIGVLISAMAFVVAILGLPPGTVTKLIQLLIAMFNPPVSPARQQRDVNRIALAFFVLIGFLGPISLLYWAGTESTLWRWTVRVLALWILVSALILARIFRRTTAQLKNAVDDGPPIKFKHQVRATQPTRRWWNWFGR